MRKLNIAFTSIGRRVELIRAFRKAYVLLQLDGCITGLDMDPLAPALRLADKVYLVPPIQSPEYIPALRQICRRDSIDAVFPLVDPDILILAENRKILKEVGTRVVAVSLEAAKIAADKWLTKEFLERLGLNVPKSWLPHQIDTSALSYPVFAKPRNGSAGKNAFQARNPKELLFFLEYVPNPIVQEYLPGPEITSDVVSDLEGNVLGIVSRRRIEVRWGEVSKGMTIFDERIMEACLRMARDLPAVGPITVQCMMKDERPYFTEINARFGGGVPLGIAAGADSPRWLLARIAGLSTEIPPLGTYQTNLYMTRYDDSFFLDHVEHEDLSTRRF